MFRLMLQKLLHKKWMVFCLLIGNVLLIATATSYPMYKNASLKKMLDNELKVYSKSADDLGLVHFFLTCRNGGNINGVNNMFEVENTIASSLNVELDGITRHFSHVVTEMNTTLERDDVKPQQVKVGMLSGLPENSDILAGRMYSDSIEDGVIEAVVTTEGMMKMNLLLDETVRFERLKDANGNKILVKIVGVVDPHKDADCWIEESDVFENELLISQKYFEENYLGDKLNKYYIRFNWFYHLNAFSIDTKKSDLVIKATEELLDKNTNALKISEPGYLSVLKQFRQTENKVTVTLMILQVPVMALLLAFLFMISGQMLSMEQNEISLLKSRGASKGQIGVLYLIQSSVMSVFSLIIGLPLGILMCQFIGSSEAFLEFSTGTFLKVKVDKEVVYYALAAVLASILVTLIPALSASGLSIVRLKAKKARSGKKLWQKLYLDFIIFGISLYGLYSFNRQTDEMAAKVLEGAGLDPLLYLSSVFFILGAGMIFLRIQPLIVKLIFTIGKKFWKPASYASFLQIIRTGAKNQFVMLFLVLTVSLGIFDSTVARTIITNSENNITYLTGSDIVLNEAWASNMALASIDPSVELVYKEPDFGKFLNSENVEHAARVYVNDKAYVKNKNNKTDVTVMAIDTKEFGNTIVFDNSVLDKHINHYLNDMAVNPDFILVSRSFETLKELKVGDKLDYYNENGSPISGIIAGFVDYWPTFQPDGMTILSDGTSEKTKNYLIISHLSVIQAEWGKTPYSVYLKLKDQDNNEFFADYVTENKIQLVSYTNLNQEKENIRKSTLFQGTNGVLTMSFIIILVLCLAGYLIYWIMSIRSRELLFGVLRAMGMKKAEIIRMLFNEQLATGIFSIAVGGVIGVIGSKLFVPMIQLAYAGDNQVTPLKLTMQSSDFIKLGSMILVMVIACIAVLAVIISKMKITNALKLGED